ncbi:NAD-dependent epimerase/dehydratase family protein [Microbacterium sp. cx-59]|uniref:NAD-dependent epimerase/dehydratase family protein n=1 Tax=Microbacterium sp. cx-59 TaxID=2891207 RepID=UPI001E449DA6|nr:NAD-dependent epimerase/dehydratase family protein [Microbacterium sp. cx-59]MCC4908035.1 NAD-dependent epimerase/dehydratase family protein [Microbacterium sp. cx-59]
MTRLSGAVVLVTGGAGFIGSHLVDALLDTDVAEVRVVDNFATGSRANLASALRDPRVHLAEHDARDQVAMARAVAGADVVFHLACLGVRHSLHDPRENHDVNATMTLDLLELARHRGVGRFVHVSSSEVYGSAQYAPMDEGHPTFPETVYGGAKLAGEAYARAAFRTHGFPVTVVRPFNAYGPRSHFEGDSGEVLPRTIVRVLAGEPPIVYGDGEQSRDFTHVTDTARAIIALAESDESIGLTVNVGSGSDVTINRLADIVRAAAGREDLAVLRLDPRPGDVRRLLAESSLLGRLTDFAPRVPFDEGVRDLLAHMRASESSPAEMLSQVAERNWAVGALAGRG